MHSNLSLCDVFLLHFPLPITNRFRFLQIVFPNFYIFHSTYGAISDFPARSYCYTTLVHTPTINSDAFRSTALQIGVDLAVTFGDFCLLLFNKLQIRRYYR